MTVIDQRAAAVSNHRGSPGPDPAQPGKEPTVNVTPDSKPVPVHAPLPEAAFDPAKAAVFARARQELAARYDLPPVDAP
jgi:hypothetical protein